MHSIVYPTQYTCDFVESCYIVFSFNSWGFGISVWVTLKWKWCYIHKIFITDYTEIVILTKFNGASDDNFIKIKPLRFPCTWPAVKHQLEWSNAPANTQRNKYVIITSKRRFHVVIMCLLLRCHLCVSLAWGYAVKSTSPKPLQKLQILHPVPTKTFSSGIYLYIKKTLCGIPMRVDAIF